jgi:hypothetical protein
MKPEAWSLNPAVAHIKLDFKLCPAETASGQGPHVRMMYITWNDWKKRKCRIVMIKPEWNKKNLVTNSAVIRSFDHLSEDFSFFSGPPIRDNMEEKEIVQGASEKAEQDESIVSVRCTSHCELECQQ